MNRCPICLRPYDFSTDGLGRLTVLHPLGKCEPPASNPRRELIPCLNCEELFEPSPNGYSGKLRKLCCESCKKEWTIKWRAKRKAERKLKGEKERTRAHWLLKLLTQTTLTDNLPPATA